MPRKIFAASGAIPLKISLAFNATYAVSPSVVALGNERNRANNTITQIFSNYDLEVAKLFANHPTLKGGSAAEQATAGAFAVASAAVNTVDTANRQVAADGEIKNWTVGATVSIGVATIRLGYCVWDGSGAAGQQGDNKFDASIKYVFSKRTFVLQQHLSANP